MPKDSGPNTVEPAPSPPENPESTAEADASAASKRWSILDSVAQQLNPPQDAAPQAAEAIQPRASPPHSAGPSQNQNPDSSADSHSTQPSRASDAVPQAWQAEATTPPLILRVSANEEGVTDQQGFTPLRDLLRRIAQ